MTSPEQTRSLIEALHELNVERERLFQLIASLANLLDRNIVVETVASLLKIEPIENGDCVVFGDMAIRFGSDNRVKSVYQTIDGINPMGKIVIQSDSQPGGDT